MLYSNKFNQNILIICTLLGTYGSDFKWFLRKTRMKRRKRCIGIRAEASETLSPRITQKALKARACVARVYFSPYEKGLCESILISLIFILTWLSAIILLSRAKHLHSWSWRVRYPDISSKSKGHQNRCPLLLELIFSAGAFGLSACFSPLLRLSICFLFFYPLLYSLIRFAALCRKLTHRCQLKLTVRYPDISSKK